MRRASGPNVSLFPFLTVLLCASGTLIVLLIALSQHVRETPPKPAPSEVASAEAPAPAPPVAVVAEPPALPAPAPPPEPVGPTVPPGPPRVVRLPYEGPDPGEPLRRRLADARTSAAELTARLDAEALRRRDAEAKIEAARFAAAEATAALASAGARLASLEQARDSGAAAAARATAEVAEFQTAVAAAAKENDSPRALLPVVRTPDGVTADRPILVECIAAGARLRPYGVTVPVGAAGPAPTGVAPVVAGVQAASAATGESYVLLIVRPDGLPSFYQVAGALTAANIRFGYELLDEDAEIAWGEATADASGTVAVAVRDALQRLPAPRPSEDDPRFTGAGFPGASGPSGQGGGGSPPGVPGPGLPGSAVGGAGRPGSMGAAPYSEAGGDPFAGGGAGAAAAGRPDLSKAFPAGSPADRLNVKGSVPALAAQPFTPSGGRLPQVAGGSGSVAPPGGAATGAGADGAAPGEGIAGMNAPPAGASPAGARPTGARPTGPRPGGGGAADSPTEAAMQALAAPVPGAETAPGGAPGGSSSTAAGGTSGSSGSAGGSAGEGGESGGEGGTAGGDAASGSTSRSFGERGRAAERDTRIRFNVRTPAKLSASYLWINGRWVPLPADNERLIAALRQEFDRRLADRGDPPAGFRWSPELRLSVRPDGRGQVERFIEAAERAGATVKIEGGTR